MRLTVLFDAPYWVALIENEEDGYLYAARYIFGAEPSLEVVHEFVLSRDYDCCVMSMTVGVPITEKVETAKINPKRLQRQIRRELEETGVSTRSQEAMRLQREENKTSRAQSSRERRKSKAAYRRERQVEKRKEKHRGR